MRPKKGSIAQNTNEQASLSENVRQAHALGKEGCAVVGWRASPSTADLQRLNDVNRSGPKPKGLLNIQPYNPTILNWDPNDNSIFAHLGPILVLSRSGLSWSYLGFIVS